ncbi:MAG TPA: hypothetical protein VN285_02165 [Candidatus Deferrimicrobium sp.]|nr:hypothetical protein [Candidatus Deferrimicrobium sp.]
MDKYTAGDAVTSLAYVSAAHVIIAHGTTYSGVNSYMGLIIILFVFVDWLSRISIPQTFQLPEDQQLRRKPVLILAKSAIEILAVYCLVLAAVRFLTLLSLGELNGVQVDSDLVRAFAVFLVASFGWNLLMLRVMHNLNVIPLSIALVKGTVFDMPGADTYTGGFKEHTRRKREAALNSLTFRSFLDLSMALIREGMGRTIAQLVGHHITWVNLLVGSFAALASWSVLPPLPWIPNSYGGSMSFTGMLLLAATVMLVSPVVFGIHCILKERNDGVETTIVKVLRWLAACLIFFSLLFFYATWKWQTIIYVIFIQHIIFGVFLVYATRANNTPISPPPPDTGPDITKSADPIPVGTV